jgi:hypothetical protein
MIATISIDDKLLADAEAFSAASDTSGIIEEALTQFVHRAALKQLIALGGSQSDAEAPPRRRWSEDGTRWEGNPE